MSTENYYLLQKSAKTEEMIFHIRHLFFSNEETNLHLAIQLLKGGGVPQDLISIVLGFSKWHPDTMITKECIQLFEQFASEKLQDFVKQNWQKLMNIKGNEQGLSLGFDFIEKYTELNAHDLANVCLELLQKGGKFCIENQTDSYHHILSKIIQNNNLVLTNYGLNFLPEEVGEFTNINWLNLTGNNFEILPQTAKKLRSLRYIFYDETLLSREYLADFFPWVMYEEYYNEACDLKTNEKYLEAEKLFRMSVQLKPDHAESWHNIGASLIFANQMKEAKKPLQKALIHYKNRLQINPNSAWNWFWKSCVHALLGEKEKALGDLKICINIDINYKEQAREEEDYRNYFEDEDFQKIIS